MDSWLYAAKISIICPQKRSNTAYNARFLGPMYVPALKFDFYQKNCLFAGLAQDFISIFALFGFEGVIYSSSLTEEFWPPLILKMR